MRIVAVREVCSMIAAGRYRGGSLLLAALMAVSFAPLQASAGPSGGHAAIALTTTPERPVAAEDTRLTIVLEDERQRPIRNASVLVRADMVMAHAAGTQHGDAGPAATATPSETPGEYLATLRLTDPGDWRISVTTGHSRAEFTVTALPARLENSAATSPPTAPASQAPQHPGAHNGHAATAEGEAVAHGHGGAHGASTEAVGPNHYFVGSILGVVVITIGMVPILRRRASRAQRAEEA
jgi:hypothetical protein